MKNALLLCAMQILMHGVLCLNFRAVAQANIPIAAGTDALVASLSFFVIKKISQSNESILEWAGYTIGSVIGSVLGIYISTYVLSQ